jgi:protocatechuate 3,4-dioxygenase beta subunit
VYQRAAVFFAVFCLALAAPASEDPAPATAQTPESESSKPTKVELSGKVSNSEDEPVSGATVRIRPTPPEQPRGRSRPADPPEPTVVKSGEDGAFHAAELVGDSFRIRVEADGFAPFTEAEIPGGASLNVRLEPGHAVSGTVLELRGGAPVPGAKVRACDAGAEAFGDEACLETESGEGGAFTLVDLPRGVVTIETLAKAHALERLPNVAVPAAETEGGKPRALEIFLKPGGDVAGRVIDLDDGPVEGARVSLRPRDMQLRDFVRSGTLPTERTDASGRFTFEGLPAGVAYALHVSAEGFTSAEEGPVSVEPGSSRETTIRLGAGATLMVRLIDPDENPVASLDVELVSDEDPPQGRGRGRGRGARWFGGGGRYVSDDKIETDDEGTFTVSRLLPGAYTVRLIPEDFAEVEKESIRLREDGTVNLGTIVVHEGERITGVVTDDTMEPIEEATVSAFWPDEGRFRRRTVRTKADGRYRVPGLGSEPVRIWASADGHVTTERANVMPGEDGVDFTLERTGSVIGRVILPDGQAPVAFQVQAHPEASDDLDRGGFGFGFRRGQIGDGSNVFSDPAGNFRVDELDPGTYTLEATTGGMAPGKKTGIRVVSDGVTDAGVITLEPGLTLRGRVLDLGDDTPVAGAAVQVSVPTSFGFRFDQPALGETTVTGSDGLFLVEGIEPGVHNVSVEHPDYSRADTRVEVTEEVDPPEIVVRLSQGGTITGTVRDAGGQPVPNTRIMLMRGRGGDLQWASTDADGRYLFERLAPATYNLTREPTGGMLANLGMKSATVEEGQTVVVDFDETPGINLTGMVVRGDETVPDAMLFFMRGDGGPGFEMKSARSEADGSYRVGLDSGGTYDVTVRTGSMVGFRGGSVVKLVVPDEPEVSLDVVLPTAGVAGAVTTVDGQPIVGARVHVQSGQPSGDDTGRPRVGVTDRSGGYVVDALEPGAYNVTASATGFTSAERVGVEVGESGLTSSVDFRLEAGRVLRGRVVDPGGRGLGGAMVFVTQAATGESFSRPAQTDVNGAFTATGPGEGAVNVTAIAGGWAPAARTGIVPREGEEIVIQVSLGGKIEVRVLGPEGQPVSGVQVGIRSLVSVSGNLMGLGSSQPRPTGPDGATTVDLLAPGPYEVFIPGNESVPRVQVGVDEGGTTPAVLTLP